MKFTPLLALGVLVAAIVPAFALAPAAHAALTPTAVCTTVIVGATQVQGSGCAGVPNGTYFPGNLYDQPARHLYACATLTVTGTTAVCTLI